MLDLRRAEAFMGGFRVRSRGRNLPVRYRPNPSQRKIMQMMIEHTDKGNRAYAIFDKCRRVGVTTFCQLMGQCHLQSKPHSQALILAQLAAVAQNLYRDAVKFSEQMPLEKSAWKSGQTETNYFDVPSVLTWKTANSVKGTRGLGYTFLHASEAAYYEDEEVFTSVLSTLSDDPENMAFIETTANGMTGPGEAYYKLWEAASRGENEFLPIFLPWWEDPEYIRPAAEAKDAPRNDYEKYLMKELGLGKERVAFHRYALVNRCGNRLDKWRKEYPGTAEEAFETSGQPVFDFDDTTMAEASQEEPLDVVEISMANHRAGTQARLEPKRGARFHIYEKPQPEAHYFMGVVIGAGAGDEDEESGHPDDTLAMVVWNGETGRMAARFVDTMHPATASELVCGLATTYNKAMVTVNLGYGGFGGTINVELRDRWKYNNPYRWKGRNDRVSAGAAPKTTGFEMTEYTRKMCLNTFISDLKRDEVKPVDAVFIEQLPGVQWEFTSYEATAGVDDVFWAGMMGWIARSQYHPKACEPQTGWGGEADDEMRGISYEMSPFATPVVRGSRVIDPWAGGMTLQRHLDKRDARERELQTT